RCSKRLVPEQRCFRGLPKVWAGGRLCDVEDAGAEQGQHRAGIEKEAHGSGALRLAVCFADRLPGFCGRISIMAVHREGFGTWVAPAIWGATPRKAGRTSLPALTSESPRLGPNLWTRMGKGSR